MCIFVQATHVITCLSDRSGKARGRCPAAEVRDICRNLGINWQQWVLARCFPYSTLICYYMILRLADGSCCVIMFDI